MFDTIAGIPVHALVVHAVVVLAPLTALLLLAFSVSGRFRTWSGWLTPAVGALTTLAAFVAASSGEELEHRVGSGGLVEEHAELGEVLPWVTLAATVVAVLLWWLWRRGTAVGAFRILAVLGVLAALGLAVDVTLVGHSGAKAVWSGIGSQPAP
ncbi:hypothetical protein H9L10_12635 [Phycicoccus endophyticus]|uniref:DUF2231 domain-containing protein n=1 Tax=Phycicoccus endophyticus TaxID=1690220 RepID=A0A7G9R0E6_9MICO|nr:DUF2231 domain-containing protein [Phycicoccus endophyticus]NHI20112.1 hypothetical protein [Phycicoccus endophyticus]QNN49071.1 hypothetical protein H9L10_12635 [Phycicoccus endophyticus]GGL38318.1 hypothetical protein GCM10012283_21120 [Phycicoccus endophyticus]